VRNALLSPYDVEVLIGGWSDFFAAEVAAFSALTGLVFVALSINLKTILDTPGTSGRAGEALIVLVEPVLLGLAGLIPHQARTALGVEWLLIGTIGWGATNVILIRGSKTFRERRPVEIVTRVVGTEGSTALVMVAGALLIAGVSNGSYWQVAGAFGCLIIGTTDAWVLLVEILR
jgi:hypothetical protein